MRVSRKINGPSSFQIILLGFAAVILIGALLLMLPISSKDRVVTPFSDALFTSTSAVCVTGLIVHDTATYWSYFGQAIILLLIQIGGLGVMTVAVCVSFMSYIFSLMLRFPVLRTSSGVGSIETINKDLILTVFSCFLPLFPTKSDH